MVDWKEQQLVFFLSTDSKPWRTRGKDKFFFFVSFFVDLDFVNDFLQKLFVDLWWEEGEGAFEVKSFSKKSKKIPTRWPSGQPLRRNSSDPPSSRRRQTHSRERRELLSLLFFVLFEERERKNVMCFFRRNILLYYSLILCVVDSWFTVNPQA